MPDVFLTPVARTTLTADICKKLVTHLLQGDWTEGDRVPAERELCQQLGVGRASLREALKALEIMGMLETRLGEGTFVCARSEFLSRPLLWAITGSKQADTHELVESRKLIEVEMAGLAAERADPDELKAIGTCLDEMEAAKGNAPRFLEADLNFHLAIGAAAHNRILMNALHLIRNLLRQWIGQTLQLSSVAAEAQQQHAEIFMAIAKRNPTAARETMKKHLNAMAQRWMEAQSSNKESQPVAPSDVAG
jgi:GntR family transcriptional repressor for pyruvate dehydrogenase complex